MKIKDNSIRFATPAGEFSFKAYYVVTAYNPQSDEAPFVIATFHSAHDGWAFIDTRNDGYCYDLIWIDSRVN